MQLQPNAKVAIKSAFMRGGRKTMSTFIDSYDQRNFSQLDISASLSSVRYNHMGTSVNVLEIHGFRRTKTKTKTEGSSHSVRAHTHLSNVFDDLVKNRFAIEEKPRAATFVLENSRNIAPVPRPLFEEDSSEVLDERNFTIFAEDERKERERDLRPHYEVEYQPIPTYGGDDPFGVRGIDFTVGSDETINDGNELLDIARSVGSRESSVKTGNTDQRSKIVIRGRLNRIVIDNYYPPSFRITRFYLLWFIVILVALLLLLDLLNSDRYTSFSLIVADIKKCGTMSANFFWLATTIIQNHLVNSKIIVNPRYVAVSYTHLTLPTIYSV
eukprot:TRINITY_DN5844_c0_g1_i1.p1 TRINITY_DN5844_c0_g1~~TRINITY_DN5844_c0_g1_i1.p1  ORF type:complete len:327 (-),score=58.83 TRINITY_DN5844_c0_g1_i1:34-1014(-)